LKVLDSNGFGRTSDVISAIEFVIANKTKLNVQIINLSLGHPIFAPAMATLVQAVEQASAAGLVVVVSNG
jgi:serine protease AprX